MNQFLLDSQQTMIVFLVSIGCLLSFTVNVHGDEATTCPDDSWIQGEHGLGCLWFDTGKWDYLMAVRRCGDKGGHLAEIHTPEQLAYMRGLMRATRVGGDQVSWRAGATKTADTDFVWTQSGFPVLDFVLHPSSRRSLGLVICFLASKDYYGVPCGKNGRQRSICQKG